MTSLPHEAWFYERQPGGRVHCTLCPHDCRIADGSRGACSVRYNEGGVLCTLVHDRIVASNLEPIEKKPFFHFMPGSLAYSVATVGCNQQCAFCQNWEIAQWPRDELPRRLVGDRGEAPIPLAALAGLIPGYGFAVRENRIKEGRCPACQARIDGVEMDRVNRRRSAA